MPTPLNLADLGRRVRAVRLARRLTLDEVVSRANFTVSWLSKLENGQLTPSLEGLVKLAEVLECGVDTLVEGLSVPPQYVVVKQSQGRTESARDGRGGYVVENLADQWRDRAMNPAIIHLSGVGNRHHPDNHDGERFLLVLDGQVKLEYGDELIHLDQGDSVYIYAAIPHVLAPAGRGQAQVLSVSYDPLPGSHKLAGGGQSKTGGKTGPRRAKAAAKAKSPPPPARRDRP
ncbi:MAG: helix-turn-helix domain-containing protein [Planctomycetia bacterium]